MATKKFRKFEKSLFELPYFYDIPPEYKVAYFCAYSYGGGKLK
jgi:hypothetical protein